jgi:hypothetical protein
MRVVALCSTVAVLLFSTLPSYSTDPQHGLVLAKRWCASCHVISPEQERANADVPPFAIIARSPSFRCEATSLLSVEPPSKNARPTVEPDRGR